MRSRSTVERYKGLEKAARVLHFGVSRPRFSFFLELRLRSLRSTLPAAAAATFTMVRSKPGITKEIGDEAMSLAYQLDSVHESRRIAQHEIKTDQACQFAEMKRRQDAIAKARPRPPATGRFAKPAPKSEIEALLHAQPQTTAQHVGHHKIPKMPPPKPQPPRNLCVPDHSPRHPPLHVDRARLSLSGRSIRSSRRDFPTVPAEKSVTTRTSSPPGSAACLRSPPAKLAC